MSTVFHQLFFQDLSYRWRLTGAEGYETFDELSLEFGHKYVSRKSTCILLQFYTKYSIEIEGIQAPCCIFATRNFILYSRWCYWYTLNIQMRKKKTASISSLSLGPCCA